MIELPWPDPKLRPNAASPGNWRRKSEAARKYRADCLTLCRAQGVKPLKCDEAELTVRITFHPPDKRRRDLDNMVASFKQGIDAFAEAIAIDDHRFAYMIRRGEPVKGGKVVVSL